MEILGWQHLTYLAVAFLFMAGFIFTVKKYVKSDKVLKIIIKCVAAALLISILLNRFFIVRINNYDWRLMLPNTFCGLSSFVLSLAVLLTKRNSNLLHFVVYIAFVGGILTMFYPDFIIGETTLFIPNIFTGLLHHTLQIFLILLMAFTGYFKSSIKKWYCVPLGLACYMTWGLFLYDIVGISALTIGGDFEGISGLTWFTAGLIFFAVYATYIISFDLISKRLARHKKPAQVVPQPTTQPTEIK